MNRRTYITAVGGGLASLVGGVAVAKATRADIIADPASVRGEGEPVMTTGTVSREEIEYIGETNSVSYGDTTDPFEKWARRECASVGSTAVLPAIDDRIDKPLEGVGKGERGLAFGLVISVNHTIARDRDGSVMSEPNVDLEKLVAVAPRLVTTTVILEEQEFTRDVPVIVRHGETQLL
jgi:hypothetical protein